MDEDFVREFYRHSHHIAPEEIAEAIRGEPVLLQPKRRHPLHHHKPKGQPLHKPKGVAAVVGAKSWWWKRIYFRCKGAIFSRSGGNFIQKGPNVQENGGTDFKEFKDAEVGDDGDQMGEVNFTNCWADDFQSDEGTDLESVSLWNAVNYTTSGVKNKVIQASDEKRNSSEAPGHSGNPQNSGRNSGGNQGQGRDSWIGGRGGADQGPAGSGGAGGGGPPDRPPWDTHTYTISYPPTVHDTETESSNAPKKRKESFQYFNGKSRKTDMKGKGRSSDKFKKRYSKEPEEPHKSEDSNRLDLNPQGHSERADVNGPSTSRKGNAVKMMAVQFQNGPHLKSYHFLKETDSEMNLEPGGPVTEEMVVKSWTAMQQTLKHVPTAHEYFDSKELPSTDSESEESANGLTSSGKDNEWLSFTHTDSSQEEWPRPSSPDPDAVDNAPDIILSSLNPLFLAMRFSGRMPFQIVRVGGHKNYLYQLNKRTSAFYIFSLITFVLLAISTTLVFNLITLLTDVTKGGSIPEEVRRAEFNKYWIETGMLVLSIFVVVAWSLSVIVEQGFFQAEYFTRWTLAMDVFQYEVTQRVRRLIRWTLSLYFLYCLILVLLFHLADIGFIRGYCGFVGVLILEPLVLEIRLSTGFVCAEYLGLFVHLYVGLCSTLILLLILVYCRMLENAARRFNLRLAYRLKKIGLPGEDGEFHRVFKPIAYDKLFGEHVAITSFSRHIGKVFNITLNALIFTRCDCVGYCVCFHFKFLSNLCLQVLLLIVSIYYCTFPMFVGFPNDEGQKWIDLPGYRPYLHVPLRIHDLPVVVMAKGVYIFIEAWIITFNFFLEIEKTGAVIMSGFNLIRRHGMILCKTSKERRFIMSMEHSFSFKPFYVSPCFPVDKNFILVVLGFVVGMFVFLIQFSPTRLELSNLVACDEAGNCEGVMSRKSSFKNFRPPTPPTLPKMSTTREPEVLPEPGPKNASVVYNDPPCTKIHRGHVPLGIEEEIHALEFNISRQCLYSEAVEYIQFPLYFNKSKERGFEAFRNSDFNCSDETSFYWQSLKKLRSTDPPLYDCFGKEVSVPIIFDDCKRPNIPHPDEKGKRFVPKPGLFVLHHPTSKIYPHNIYCCFRYKGDFENNISDCNIVDRPNYRNGDKPCLRKSEKDLYRFEYENALWRKLAVEDKAKDINTTILQSIDNYTLWVDCICQLAAGRNETTQKLLVECKDLLLDIPPCDPRFHLQLPRDIFTTADCEDFKEYPEFHPSRKSQFVYKKDQFHNYLPVLYQAIQSFSTHVTKTCKTNEYPRNYDLKKHGTGVSDTFTDCYGKPVALDTNIFKLQDDCRNFPVEKHPINLLLLKVLEGGLAILKPDEYPFVKEDMVLCCSTAGPLKNSTSICGLPIEDAAYRCHANATDRSPEKIESVANLLTLIGNVSLSDKVKDAWNPCICKDEPPCPSSLH